MSESETHNNPIHTLRALSPQDLLGLGNHQIGYIRSAIYNGETGFSLHAADGTPLAFRDAPETIQALARQNDLDVSLVH